MELIRKSRISYNVMTFLCISGAFWMGPIVSVKIYGIVLNTMKNTCDP